VAEQLRDALRKREARGTRIGASALMDRVEAELGTDTRLTLGASSPEEVVPRWGVGLAAALAVMLVVGGTALGIWLFAETDTRTVVDQATPTVNFPAVPSTIAPQTTATVGAATTVPAPPEPGTVFSWESDLSKWVTEDEMTALLEELSRRFYADTGGDLGGEAVLARPGGDLVWAVGYWSVGVHPWGGYHPTPTKTDPRLPEGVTYEGMSQSYGFSGPNSSQSICITLTTPGGTASIEDEPNYQTIFFAIASMMLREMGWVD